MSAASFDVSGVSGTSRTPGPAPFRDADFPGCESFHLPASELDVYEGRLEFWDGATETAWRVREGASLQHEGPSRRLVQMAERVAALRARGIEAGLETTEDRALLGGLPGDALMAAALACTDAADFRRRIRE